jgi:hypothetical protein
MYSPSKLEAPDPEELARHVRADPAQICGEVRVLAGQRLLVVEARLEDDQVLIVDEVDQAMLIGDPT